MTSFSFRHSAPFWLTTSVLVLGGVLSSRAAGVASGVSSVPANASRAMNSCAACHSSSGPTATRTNPPVTTLTVGSLVLAAGQQTPVTTAVTAGVAGTTGGFLCEATRGTFTATSGNHINGTGGSITHSDRTHRSWSYTYTAPATPGPVELTSAALTANNNGSDSGDQFSFTGFDANATVGTPVRLYVLPAGLTNLGNPCSDGYANRPVLGALTSPTIGNSGFQFHMVGTAPSSYAMLLLGINPPAFPGVPLDIIGINGCTGYVASPVSMPSAITSAGNTMRAEGSCTFAFPIPSSTVYVGFTFDAQGAVLDGSVAATRPLPFTMSNGVHVVVQ